MKVNEIICIKDGNYQDNPYERLYTGYRTSASAINIAIDRLRREGMFLETEFKFEFRINHKQEQFLKSNHNV